MSGDFADETAMPVRERWRTILLVVTAALGAAVLTGLVLTLGEATRQRDRALAAQGRSYEVMILARTLSATIARAEASLGRYVISGDQQLGAAYSADWSLAGTQIRRLTDVTADSPDQQARMRELRGAYYQRGEELSATALSTRYGKNNQALARYYQARQATSLTRIDKLLDAVIARERDLLGSRTKAAMAGVEQSNRSVKILIVFGILIVLAAIALGWATAKALGDRAIARAEAEAERERSEELEAAVAAATEELRIEALERAETEALLRQAQKMDAVGQLTGGIAHDFNNMLAVVVGGLELAKRQLTDESAARRHIDNATDGANRAAALTKRLLAFARQEPLRPEAIDPAALIGGMSDLLERTLGGTIRVIARDDGAQWRVWADRHQLENAILNLAVNARDAMAGKGQLTISTGAQSLGEREVGECAAGDYVTIAVGDTGCGIAPDVLERVFEPFFTTKPVGQGTGLGLSQIFAFVRQSTGEIAINSTEGAGTTVTIYLPRHIAVPMPVKAIETPAPAIVEMTSGFDILVVEDDPRVLTATMESLIELGHRPVACTDPVTIVAQLEAMAAIDLILSDVLMPGRTGPEMIAGLPPQWGQVPVLFVTGYAGELEQGGFGGHAVLRKPFTLAALERAVAEAAAVNGEARAAA